MNRRGAPARLLIVGAVILLAACASRRSEMRPVAQPNDVELIKPTTHLAVTLNAVCLGGFPDGFGSGTDVLVGVEVTDLKFARGGSAPEPIAVRRTFTSPGQVSGECVQFSGFDIGVVPYRGERFNLHVYVRKLPDAKGKERAGRVLDAAADATKALGAVIPSPIEDVVFETLIAPQYDEALLFQYDMLFEDPEAKPGTARRPTSEPLYLVGTTEKSGWFGEAPTVLKDAKFDLETGKLMRGGKPVKTPTLILTMHAIKRSLSVKAWLLEQEKLLHLDVFRVPPQRGKLVRAVESFASFMNKARPDLFSDEALLLNDFDVCAEQWRTYFEAYPSLSAAAQSEAELSARQAAVDTLVRVCAPAGLEFKECEAASVKRRGVELYREEQAMMCDVAVALKTLQDDVKQTLQARRDEKEKIAAQAEAKAKTAALDSAKTQKAEFEKMLSDFGIRPASAFADLTAFHARVDAAKALERSANSLKEALKSLVAIGVDVTVRKGRLLVTLPGDVLFASGRAEVLPAGREALLKVIAAIRADAALAQRPLQIEGHTDNVPVTPSERVPDNLTLSFLRARAVLALLSSVPNGFSPAQLSAAGFGDVDPVADNAMDEGRAKNRRVALAVPIDAGALLDLVK